MFSRKALIIKIKKLWAAHHYIFVTQDIEEIAKLSTSALENSQTGWKHQNGESASFFGIMILIV